jgi:hypothetical protein
MLSFDGFNEWWYHKTYCDNKTLQDWEEINKKYPQTIDHINYDEKSESKSYTSQNSKRVDLNEIPEEIRRMHKKLIPIMKLNQRETDFSSAVQNFQKTNEIREPQPSSRLFNRFWVTPHITTDFNIAYDIMCCRYIESNSVENGESLMNQKNTPIGDLITKYMPKEIDMYTEMVLLTDLFQYYHPKGHLLSTEEQQEIMYSRIQYRLHQKNSLVFETMKPYDIESSNFKLMISTMSFKDWLRLQYT